MTAHDHEAASAFATDLGAFVTQSPSSFHAVATVSRTLLEAGYTELHEAESWDGITTGSRYFVRRDGSIIAFDVPTGATGTTPLRIFGAHTDSPHLSSSPRAQSARTASTRLVSRSTAVRSSIRSSTAI